MEDLPTVHGESRCVVGHQPLSLGDPDSLAEICLSRRAEIAFAAFGRVKGDNMIAWLEVRYACTHLLDDGATFVAQNGRENSFRVFTG